ncbi:hypothetical protein Mp_5g18440 [Marchantia polymorpha subsp. ruderalis]|uniref:Uncharacterized protein n=2 Tax=Marchantia polymorpha TaxID=3197 RepID=A0AAF6BJQ9_MARPO|nr:hypothetical protein MARPO_0073s0096 [Marchantia polymorpha]BBN12243.1 hypothetical protein Mp_5g18440 [Marchantia polymorpha subsp. ruderalis]|eukprot:PTQ35232.1 hypothetical protein MARPO_0073s0096 [Marchantia polymorpha]
MIRRDEKSWREMIRWDVMPMSMDGRFHYFTGHVKSLFVTSISRRRQNSLTATMEIFYKTFKDVKLCREFGLS